MAPRDSPMVPARAVFAPVVSPVRAADVPAVKAAREADVPAVRAVKVVVARRGRPLRVAIREALLLRVAIPAARLQRAAEVMEALLLSSQTFPKTLLPMLRAAVSSAAREVAVAAVSSADHSRSLARPDSPADAPVSVLKVNLLILPREHRDSQDLSRRLLQRRRSKAQH